MRVLVFTPVLRGRWFDLSSKAMFRMLPLEDGGQVEYLQLVGGDTGEHPFDNITRKCNEARDLVLRMGYDALMIVEGDVIVPPEALRRLVAVEADVAYGLVIHTHGWPTWNACCELKDEAPGAIPISLFPEMAREAWGKVIEVDGVGSSCMLIHRRVLEALTFWGPYRATPAEFARFQRSCDWFLAQDCKEAGFVQKNDTRVICGHIETDTIPRILWPDITREGFYRSEVIGPMPKDILERVQNEPYTNAGFAAIPP